MGPVMVVELRYQEKRNIEEGGYERKILHLASSLPSAETWIKKNEDKEEGYRSWWAVYPQELDTELLEESSEIYYYSLDGILLDEQPDREEL